MPPRDQLQVKMEEEHDETHESDASVEERQKLQKVRQNSRARERYLMFGSILLRKKRKETPTPSMIRWFAIFEFFFKECSNSYFKPSFQP